MITIDLVDEHFDQKSEKPVRVQVHSARAGRESERAAHNEHPASQVQHHADHSRPGLFAGIWFGIKKLFNR